MDFEAPVVPNPALVVNDLTFRYRGRAEPSIAGISFEMRRGELLLLAGFYRAFAVRLREVLGSTRNTSVNHPSPVQENRNPAPSRWKERGFDHSSCC